MHYLPAMFVALFPTQYNFFQKYCFDTIEFVDILDPTNIEMNIRNKKISLLHYFTKA